ncbi:M20/M25/M40 family metallo-hydrolase [Acuticoccus sp. M5D2P5]|uniref:M20/M25/M40 family metallo-hydrolase n=1 Tax=Acuticoccus kalidii TaxID=2910977 RepID=UPI001F28BEF2|nr:M20/M25/M40 family metallo-hydrolase [Acuticoccus kalidii]MCF3933444.1 M20/M25/M40 family metallo-hydrolase [Acuticoccus kalidii]
MAPTIESVLDYLERTEEASLERLFEWLRIPSVSAQSDHADDCTKAATWFRDRLTALGFTARVHPTDGRPAVIASYPAPDPDAPTLLYYGHYDVQPAAVGDGWTSEPFEPIFADGDKGRRIVARGATDDKGQVMIWLAAFEAWIETHGTLPVGIFVVLEGEEEVGSANFEACLHAVKDEVKADVAVISDGNMWDIDTPLITTRLRGRVNVEVAVKTATSDLHSGLFGGVVPNALNLLTGVLAELADEDGRVQLAGFYDDIVDPPADMLAQWEALALDETALLASVGLSEPAGEAGRTPLERLWSRPTFDINGIWGGYIAEGSKTVIPNEAHAKLSFRLVPGQDPEAVRASIEAFFADRLPPDVQFSMQTFAASAAIEIPTDTPWMGAAEAALSAEYGRPAVLGGCGGSLPVVETIGTVLGLDVLLFSFGLDDDRPHGPDEKFELACFRHGARAHARILAEAAAFAASRKVSA